MAQDHQCVGHRQSTVVIGITHKVIAGEYADITDNGAVFLLLQRIASEPAYGQQLAEEFGMTTPNIYHHMGKLVQAKFVNTRIDRNRNYYSINKNYINQLLDELKGILRC